MSERRETGRIRTERPDTVQPSVRDVLALEVLRAGMPDVVAGHAGLDAPVRWVHASDNPDVPRLLEGSELVLTTGSAWPAEEAALADLAERFVAADVAGIVLELGTRFAAVPASFARAADEHGLLVVALHREVRFVAVTEAVHARIIAAQTAALAARDDVRERFTALALRGAPTDHVVRQASQTLGCGVVLEDLAHRVVVAAFADVAEEDSLEGWAERSRWGIDLLIVPVEARGSRWGRLIALPGPPHPAGRRSVLEQAAIALAIGRLAEGGTAEWDRMGQGRLLDALLEGRFAHESAVAARLEAAGLPVRGRTLVGVALRPPVEPAAIAAALPPGARAVVSLGAEAAAALVSLPGVRGAGSRSSGGGSAGSRSFGFGSSGVGSSGSGSSGSGSSGSGSAGSRSAGGGSAGSRSAGSRSSGSGGELDAAAASRLASIAGGVVAIGRAADDVDGGLASVREATALAQGGGDRIRRADDLPLARLIGELAGDHRLLAHGERMLAPLVDHDLRRGGDLVDVLEAMLAHPGNRTAAAAASHLSRSVFYQRLEVIERLLGVSLDDGETQTALHLAVLARRRA